MALVTAAAMLSRSINPTILDGIWFKDIFTVVLNITGAGVVEDTVRNNCRCEYSYIII